MAILSGASRTYDLPDAATVLLARELTPSQTAEIPRHLIAGIVTETGSPTSHAAILARTLGIPAVVGVRGILSMAEGASWLAVDGRTGEVHVAAPRPGDAAGHGRRSASGRDRRRGPHHPRPPRLS